MLLINNDSFRTQERQLFCYVICGPNNTSFSPIYVFYSQAVQIQASSIFCQQFGHILRELVQIFNHYVGSGVCDTCTSLPVRTLGGYPVFILGISCKFIADISHFVVLFFRAQKTPSLQKGYTDSGICLRDVRDSKRNWGAIHTASYHTYFMCLLF